MLLVKPEPIQSESAKGYLLRLSEANGSESIRWLLKLIKEGSGKERGISALSCLLNRDAASLRDLRGPISNMAQLNASDQKNLPMRYWNTRRPRYCPECLQENAYWRGQWDILFCVICSKHQSLLADHCTNCSLPLSWSRTSLVKCKCGWDLRKVKQSPAHEMWLPIAAQLDTHYDGEILLQKGYHHIAALSEEAYLKLIWFIGAYGSFNVPKPQKISRLHEVKIAAQVFTTAADLLDQWPLRFHQFLARLSERHSDSGSGNKLRSLFGSFYPTLYRNFKENEFSFLTIAFEEFVRINWSGQLAGRHRRLSAASRNNYEWIPIGKAAKAIGIRASTIQSLIKQNSIDGRIFTTPKGRSIGVVHKTEIDRLIKERANMLTLKEARARIGISRKRAEALMAEGILVPLNVSKDASGAWVFDCNHVLQVTKCLGSMPSPS